MSDTMRAVRFHEYGGSDKLVVESLPRPKPKEGEVVVKVLYAGVNPVDWKIRAGYLKDFMPLALPFIPGIDFSGSIEEVGPEVSGFKAGDRVFGIATGAYSEFAVASASDIAPMPDGVADDVAATVPVGALTAWQAIEDARVSSGETVVVQGAAGGVGSFAAQFAKLKGAHVVAVASGANTEFLRALGVDRVVDYTAEQPASTVSAVDAVIDTVGGDVLEQSYGLLRSGGRVVTVAGQHNQEKAKEHGVEALQSGRGSAEKLGEIAKLLSSGKLTARVGEVFDLSKAADAHDLSQTGHGRGRILLKVAG